MIQIAKYVEINEYVRIRPSVSWVEKEDNIVEFFIGNTRGKKLVQVAPELVGVMRRMNGLSSIREICELEYFDSIKINEWIETLISWSVAERLSISTWINKSPFRRALNMIGDFIPDYDLERVWSRIGETQFFILGCGAVGSWVADGVVRMGGRDIVLVDPDNVGLSNINRSLFSVKDVGVKKTTSLSGRIISIRGDASVKEFNKVISCVEDIDCIIDNNVKQVFISCMDSPNVDVAAGIVNDVCVKRGISFVIAGGYNLHLSLIGITVIPKVSACFNCSLIHLNNIQMNELLPVKKLDRPHRNIGNIAPLSAVTASIAAMESVRLAANDERMKPVMLNKRGEFNFFTETFEWMDIPMQSNCSVCGVIV